MDFTIGIVSRNLANTSNFETVGSCTFFEASSIGCHKTTCDVTVSNSALGLLYGHGILTIYENLLL